MTVVQRGRPNHALSTVRAKNARGTLLRLAVYFAPFRASLVVVTVSVVGYSLIGLAGPWLMARAIDGFIAKKDASGLASYALAMLAAFLASNALQLVGNFIMARVSQEALRDLRRELFARLQKLPLAFFDRNPSGELMSRLTNDVDTINQAVSQNVTALVASVLSMAGILVAMFALNAWLALASLLVVPLMLGFTRAIAGYTRRGFQDLQKSLGALNAVMEESIGGQRVVKLFRRSESVSTSFRAKNEDTYRAGVAANTYALLLMPLTTVLGNLFIIVLASVGGFLALHDLVTVGVIAAFINYGQSFVGPLRQISNLYNTIQAALAGAERVLEIIDAPAEVDVLNGPRLPEANATAAADAPHPAPRSPPDAPRLPSKSASSDAAHASQSKSEDVDSRRGAWTAAPIAWSHVVFDHVTFSYREGTPVIRDVSLDAKPGEMVALVGPTGAGKTTIINLLTRFYELDSGSITIDGVDLRNIEKSLLRTKIGLVLQDTFLFSATVRENIRYGRLDASDDDVIAAAKLADADHFIRQLPHGYDTMLSERASNLSQGQRQLLAIARTLLADPAILVLDEATSSVDTRTEARIQGALLRLMKGRTSFVIAHRLSTIRDADQVLVIDNGGVVERGTHDELLAKRGFYHRLYLAQFKGQHAA
jgi:ATP-binding cassette subfamily B protein